MESASYSSETTSDLEKKLIVTWQVKGHGSFTLVLAENGRVGYINNDKVPLSQFEGGGVVLGCNAKQKPVYAQDLHRA